jgi:hypothetical protein
LALLSIEESGSAEQIGGYRAYRRGRYDDDGDDDDEFEVVEVFNRSETLSDWRRPDGAAARLGPKYRQAKKDRSSEIFPLYISHIW